MSTSGTIRSSLRGSVHAHRPSSAITEREVYGGFVATPAGATLLVASASSPAVAQMLTHAAEAGPEAESGAVPVEDVVAASPAGAALASSVLPLVIAGLLTGVVAATLASGALARAGLVVAGSILAGLVATAIVHG